jgi:hypothetical protein
MAGDVSATRKTIAHVELVKFPARLVKLAARDEAWRVFTVARWIGLLSLALGCAQPDLVRVGYPRVLMLAYDDNHATASLTFPNLTHESIVRFELPAGRHRPVQLSVMAASAGTIAITFYDNTVLEGPGEEIHVRLRQLVAEDLSNGKDGRWTVESLQDLPSLKGTIWVGVRKVGGTPSIWTSSVVSGQTYFRDGNHANAIGWLLPVKRTPMLRLEVLP